MAKPIVFVDTSVFVAALLSETGGSFSLLSNYREKIIFKTNQFVLDELEELLHTKFSKVPNMQTNLFLLLGLSKVMVNPYPQKSKVTRLQNIISKKDSPILAGAINSCDFLLTLDNEFFNEKVTLYAKLKNLSPIKPKELIEILGNNKK